VRVRGQRVQTCVLEGAAVKHRHALMRNIHADVKHTQQMQILDLCIRREVPRSTESWLDCCAYTVTDTLIVCFIQSTQQGKYVKFLFFPSVCVCGCVLMRSSLTFLKSAECKQT